MSVPPLKNHWLNHQGVRSCAETILAGGVVAYPTEAVWGLGCLPDDQQAVEQILALKKRSWRKGLILVAANIEQFSSQLMGLSAEQRETLAASWPGANTWLVPNNGTVPPWISGDHSAVALRVSNHPVVTALCRQVGGPIVSTSANPQGKPSATSSVKVRKYFAGESLQLAPGRVGKNQKASTIKDLLTGNVVRAGG
ncbi:Threonylcarbamoyl-AMP synthase [Sinobacterium norvegicum]|uniref:Threonylcarbamoyl-AMP synthase n=1 Tax=Sinobacterium norvegicum TaxID=1641715 RepID=A0ABN8EKY0_9GAMM|nr:Sua5/YciO/YrdC/YwlC family protein [Sinobacterium norvegicum]CAH0993002.1 Threonylcarbamoyl-AMP synthase [Sinobacterium norvegicum]